MADHALVVHQLPGRVRLRVQQRRGDAGYFSALSQDLPHLQGVRRVKVNPATASVVIEYAGSTEHLMRQLRFHDLFVESQPDRPAAPAHPTAQRMAPLRLVSGRDINPMFMLGALFTVIGIVQTIRGNIFVPAISTLWYARSAFGQASAPERPTK